MVATSPSSPQWRPLIAFLLFNFALAILLFQRISLLHWATLLVASFGAGLMAILVRPTASPVRRQWPWVAVFLLIAAGKYALIWHTARQYVPALHDEWSYLFGAQIIARGHLTAPAPPEPEAFQPIHVLIHGDRWMSRYPPGHLFSLALAERFAMPWLVPMASILLAGILLCKTAASLFPTTPAAIWTAAIVAASPGLDEAATSYLSQSTWILWTCLALWGVVEATRRDQLRWTAMASVACGLAFLTRPYSAALVAAGLAAYALGQLAQRPTRLAAHLLAALPGIAFTVAAWCGYNMATVNRCWTGPWWVYNERFEPDNRLGFGATTAPSALPTDERLRAKAAEIRRQRHRFTLRQALRRSFLEPDRFHQYLLAGATFVGVLGLAASALVSAELRVAMAPALALAAHYLGYGFFYSTWGMYAVEAAPLWILLCTLGAVAWTWNASGAGTRLAVSMLLAVNLAASAAAFDDFARRRRAETEFHRSLQHLRDALGERRAILFYRFDPKKPHPYDPIVNDPWLETNVLVVLDRGEAANRRLLDHFADRAAFIFDEASGKLAPFGQ